MSEFITLSCPSCGHKLQITGDVDRFACAACGNEHIVYRSGGIVTLKPVIDSISKVQTGVDKTASELAIVRLKEEIHKLEDTVRAQENTKGSGGCEFTFIGWACWALILIFLFVRGMICYGKGGCAQVTSIGMIISFIMGIVFFIIGSIKKSSNNELVDKEIQELKSKLELKQKQLAEHEELVSK